jgi:hypothetical protein
VFVIYISKAIFILLPVSGEINSTVLPSLKYLYNTTVKIPVDILLEKYLKLNVESGFEENKSHMMTIVQSLFSQGNMGHYTAVSVRDDDHIFVLVRRVCRYQRANQNPYTCTSIEEEQKTQSQQ